MKKQIVVFNEIDETVKWLKDNLSAYKTILVLTSAFVISKRIINALGEALVPYGEIYRFIDHCRIVISNTTIEARPVGDGSKLQGRINDLIVVYDPHSLPANVLKEILS